MTAARSVQPPSRREMLYYLGGASLGLLAVGSCAASVWMAMPEPPEHRFRVEKSLPSMDMRPYYVRAANCYLIRADETLIALDPHCPYDQEFVYWDYSDFRCLECRSRFYADGRWMRGKAPRDMDRFVLEVVASDDQIRTSETGDFVLIEDASRITVDTARVIQGQVHA